LKPITRGAIQTATRFQGKRCSGFRNSFAGEKRAWGREVNYSNGSELECPTLGGTRLQKKLGDDGHEKRH